MESTTIQDYLDYTQSWQDVFAEQDALEISQYLNSGFSFSITRNEFDKMKKRKANYLHYYLGIKDKKFVILVIDDVADATGNHNSVLVKELTNAIDFEFQNTGEEVVITEKEALKRSFRWKLFSTNWIDNRVENFKSQRGTDVVAFYPLIKNPFVRLIC